MFRVIGTADGTNESLLPVVIDHASHLFSFELKSDASGGEAYANVTLVDDTMTIKKNVKLKYKYELLDGARAGYKGDCFGHNTDDAYWFTQGPCVTKCESAGKLNVGTAPEAKVGDAYTHTISGSGLNPNTYNATDLPPGLSIDASTGEITGTPTQADTYYVTVTATSAKTGPGTVTPGSNCTLTQVLKITVKA